jgi:Sulfotransferase domain
MRVIGVGFARTGTASLKLALERLGVGPCYHMFEITDQPARARGWLAAARGQQPEWDTIFAGYHSTVDWPGAAFWRELLDAYPHAGAILTVRDPQRWYDSMERTIFRGAPRSQSPLAQRMLRLITVGKPELRDLAAMVQAVVMQRVFDGRTGDRAYAVGVYQQHNAEVRATVPAHRLLVFDVAQGWQPLCAFLNVPVPDEPFPHVNDTAEFRRWQVAGMARLMLPMVAAAGLAAAALLASGVLIIHRVRQTSAPG